MATRFDKFTIKAQEALQGTQDVAGRYRQPATGASAPAAGIDRAEGGHCPKPSGPARGTARFGRRRKRNKAIEILPKVGGTTDHYLSPALKEVLDQASKETEQFKDEFVSTEHLLLALSRGIEGRRGPHSGSGSESPTTPS